MINKWRSYDKKYIYQGGDRKICGTMKEKTCERKMKKQWEVT